MTGHLYGIGIGPGDPELITLKALRRLQDADVVAYPAPETGESLARRIAAPHLTGKQEEFAIRMPIQVERFPAQAVYDEAAISLGRHLDAGRSVAVLCEGDPFFYGSFMYLFGRLAERYPVEIVPGVSSLTACAAQLASPLASRNDMLTVLPGPLEEARLRAGLAVCDAAAIIKLGRHFGKVRDLIEAMGLTDRARYVAHATMETQTMLPLSAVEPDTVPYFSMILVHKRGEAWR